MSNNRSEELIDVYADKYRDPFDTTGVTDEDADLPNLPLDALYGSSSQSHDAYDTASTPSQRYTAGAPRASAAASDSGGFMSRLFRPSADVEKDTGADYLKFERRSLTNQMSYNVGYSYFGGLCVGGMYGLLYGLRSSPSPRPRILLNSILNGCGKYGAKTGNAAGILAMVYTIVERKYEDFEVDKLPMTINNAVGMDMLKSRYDWMIPATAAFTTGALFTMPRAITMKGLDKHYVTLGKRLGVMLSGGIATVVGVATLAVVGPFVFGKRSPYRFAN